MSQFPHIEACIATLQDSGSPCWRIVKRHRKDGNNVFMATSENKFEIGADESKDSLRQYLPESCDHLQDTILRLPPGMYVLKIFRNWTPNGLAKCVQEWDFDVPKENGSQNVQRIGAAPQTPALNIDAIVAEKVQAAMDKMELAKLREENAQLMEMVDDPAGWKKHLATAIGSVNEMAPQTWPMLLQGIANRFFPPLGKVAGAVQYPGKPVNHHTENQTEEYMNPEDMTPEQKEIMAIYDDNADAFGEVLFRLIGHDRELLTTLQKLADKLDSGAFSIAMIKPMLG